MKYTEKTKVSDVKCEKTERRFCFVFSTILLVTCIVSISVTWTRLYLPLVEKYATEDCPVSSCRVDNQGEIYEYQECETSTDSTWCTDKYAKRWKASYVFQIPLGYLDNPTHRCFAFAIHDKQFNTEEDAKEFCKEFHTVECFWNKKHPCKTLSSEDPISKETGLCIALVMFFVAVAFVGILLWIFIVYEFCNNNNCTKRPDRCSDLTVV